MANPVYDPENLVVRSCVAGMAAEGDGNTAEAARLFGEAWAAASYPFERFTAAHFLARHQSTMSDKLHWDQVALTQALSIDGDFVNGTLPSLYLNIGKCYEDLGNFTLAKENYLKGEAHIRFLENDGYGNMIKSGIAAGLARIDIS